MLPAPAATTPGIARRRSRSGAISRCVRRRLLVAVAARHEDFHGQDAIGRVAGVDVRQPHEAARQQRRADEQQDGERRFRRQQAVAQPPRAHAAEAAGGRAVAAVQRLGEVEAAPRSAGARPAAIAVKTRGARGEREHRRVELNRVEPRKVARRRQLREAHERPRQPEPERAARGRQHEALGEQLARDARTRWRRSPRAP